MTQIPDRESSEPEIPSVERTGVVADDPSAPRATPERRWQELARLMSVSSRSLAPLVRMSTLADGVSLTHRLPADSRSLAALRAVGPLRAGHALTVALVVAEALVDLDEQGLAHGGVSADQVVVGPDGTVVLAGCGLAWRRPPGDVDGPRVVDDVAALGELVRDLLGAGSSPSSLVLAALRAADPDPALRPTPRELTALLRRCGRADPLLDVLWGGSPRAARADVTVEPTGRGAASVAGPPPVASATPVPLLRADVRATPGPGPERDPGAVPDRSHAEVPDEAVTSVRGPSARAAGAPRRPAVRDRRRPRGRRRRGPLVLGLVMVLALLTLAAVRVGARALAEGPVDVAAVHGTGPVGSAAGATVDLDRGSTASGPDWLALLSSADAGRQRALAAGDATVLATWVDPDGSAWAADAALAARVSALGARIDGGALVVLEVRPRQVTSSQAELLVQDRRDAYSVVTSAGTSEVSARAPRWWQVTLRRTTDSDGSVVWRLRDVEAVAAPTG